MSEALKMFDPTTSGDSRSATFLRELASGLMRFGAQDGATINLSGPVRVRANLSARQAKALGLMMSGTCGQHGTGLSSSADLQRSLASKFQARTQSLGSTLFRLTWKQWVLPSGRSLSRLRASVLRTSATALTSWPTPTTRDHKDGAECVNVPLNALLGRVVWMASWPTPQTSDSTGGGQAKRAMGETRHGSNLNDFAMLAASSPARRTDSGELLTGSLAETKSGGQLNPAHSRWLMALPREWDDCVPMETRSMQKRQRNSSDPQCAANDACAAAEAAA